MYKVRADREQITKMLQTRMRFFVEPSDETLNRVVAEILINEKGYPEDTVVEINCSDPMAMALVVDDDGSWELV
ncbi:hypothetical protein FDI40_gp468 [Agrobacterium phage Atu_ph07]|uniref:Uncharacterized protein n=1 Tax=Agrobacterium phage Atu_ph07 TaxID=2024264 RepID=A0A2L0V0B6_9CAUD|nr:hypothetical protein FDI40_gp468 [Agrobacterium phage Atu_ph07]AUZ95227.1 hypothetical protein [Agrobacterium phage Atu_ph07]